MITTHVLDTSKGRPAAGITVVLEHAGREIARGVTDADGRLRLAEPPAAGEYRLTFDVKGAFYPVVTVVFTVADPKQHHHVPLLLSPYGYSTYRGS
jgi:5-hydroxyisourate hydrolase